MAAARANPAGGRGAEAPRPFRRDADWTIPAALARRWVSASGLALVLRHEAAAAMSPLAEVSEPWPGRFVAHFHFADGREVAAQLFRGPGFAP